MLSPGVVYDYLQRRGVDRNHALGILANIKGESGFDPNVNERNPVVPGSAGGYGLFQHTGPRRRALFEYAGTDRPHWKAQIDYALSEPEGRDYLARDFSNPMDAVQHFVHHFERPANPRADTIKRIRHLSTLMPEIERGAQRNPFAYASGGRNGFPGKEFRADLIDEIFGEPGSDADPDVFKDIFGAPPPKRRAEPTPDMLQEIFELPKDVAEAPVPELPEPVRETVPVVEATGPEAPVFSSQPEALQDAAPASPASPLAPAAAPVSGPAVEALGAAGAALGDFTRPLVEPASNFMAAAARSAGEGLQDWWRQLQNTGVSMARWPEGAELREDSPVGPQHLVDTEQRLRAEDAAADQRLAGMYAEAPVATTLGQLAPYAVATLTPTPLDDLAAAAGLGAGKLLARPARLLTEKAGRAATLLGSPNVRRQAWQAAHTGGLVGGVGGHAPWYAPYTRLPQTLATRAGKAAGQWGAEHAPTALKVAAGAAQGATRGAVVGAPIGLLSYEPDASIGDRALAGAGRGALAGGVIGGALGPKTITIPPKAAGVGNKVMEGNKPFAIVATKNGKLEGSWKHPETGEEFREASKAFPSLSKAVATARRQSEHSIVFVDQAKNAYFVEVAKIPKETEITPALLKSVGEHAGKWTWVPGTEEWAPVIAKQSGWTKDPATGRFYLIDSAQTSELPLASIARDTLAKVKKWAKRGAVVGAGTTLLPEDVQRPIEDVTGIRIPSLGGLLDLTP